MKCHYNRPSLSLSLPLTVPISSVPLSSLLHPSIYLSISLSRPNLCDLALRPPVPLLRSVFTSICGNY